MKIATLIVGKITFKKYIIEEIIRCYDLNNPNTDIFIYNNCSTETNEEIINCIGEEKFKSVNTIFQTDYEQICDLKINEITAKTKNIISSFKKICINQNIINNNSISCHVPFKSENFIDNLKKISFHQYYQLYLGILEIEKYEKKNNFKYDFIMKIRLDFFLKNNKFGPIHYFNDKNDVLLKSYNNLKYYYDKIEVDDEYYPNEFRINNYLYWRTTKYLGGQFILNKKSYEEIKSYLKDRGSFNETIKKKFIITINDACFFGSGDNFKKIVNELYTRYMEFYDENIKFWWTAESQFLLSILKNNLFYFDYLQNDNFYNGREMWVNDYHGIEKYDKEQMKTD